VADRVFLTGATGFVGAHILDALIDAGYSVRALVRSDGARIRVQHAQASTCERVVGDLAHPGDLVRALDGCRYVVHCAALYSFAPSARAAMHAINVVGTAGLFEAAHLAGVERAVLTSSSATAGHEHDGRPATEETFADASGMRTGAYHHSKLDQERAAFASRVPVVAVLPTAPIGAGDWKPTPTGAMILDFARGKMFAKPPGAGGMNLVAVEDVARAHVAALTHGRIGERYLVGGENLPFDRLWAMLATITGRSAPRWRVPVALALGIAYGDELRCRLSPHARPFVPLEGVRMSLDRMFVDASKAQRELGIVPSSVEAALERAVAYYRDNGYLN